MKVNRLFAQMSAIALLFIVQAQGPSRAGAQLGFKQRAMQIMVCGGSAVGGLKLGQKLADQQAAKMHMSPAQAAALRRKYEIGMAMALCKGGKLVAGTVYANLSKHDQEARQKDIDAALADEQPETRNYVVPDHPDMKGTLTTTAAVTDGDSECRTVEDHLAEGTNGDSALVKYCRKPPSTNWEVSGGGLG
jgi:hypothetical protein